MMYDVHPDIHGVLPRSDEDEVTRTAKEKTLVCIYVIV